ncbi:MAG: hypothetical protein U1E28_12765 [Beijerinckiaceae bacterium]
MFRFVDRPGDFVDLTSLAPDGAADARFQLRIGGSPRSIKYLKLEEVDAGGVAISRNRVWDTKLDSSGTFKLQMFRSDNSQPLGPSGADGPIAAATPLDAQLIAADNPDGETFFQPGRRFRLSAIFSDNAAGLTSLATIYIPDAAGNTAFGCDVVENVCNAECSDFYRLDSTGRAAMKDPAHTARIEALVQQCQTTTCAVTSQSCARDPKTWNVDRVIGLFKKLPNNPKYGEQR